MTNIEKVMQCANALETIENERKSIVTAMENNFKVLFLSFPEVYERQKTKCFFRLDACNRLELIAANKMIKLMNERLTSN
jgi:hypothetical protein